MIGKCKFQMDLNPGNTDYVDKNLGGIENEMYFKNILEHFNEIPSLGVGFIWHAT